MSQGTGTGPGAPAIAPPAEGFADLHLHTHFSDGGYSPRDLVLAACQQQLAAIAVTDHDTVDGLAEVRAVAATIGIEILGGTEITARAGEPEVHILGYFLGEDWNQPALRAVLDQARQVRAERAGKMVAKLNQLGIALTLADVTAGSVCGTVGRPHVALALQRRGAVATFEEAFDRYLKRGKPAYIDRYRMTAAEAIGHIHAAGGVAVLAHPGINQVDKRIREMVDQGLDGLEVWHPKHSGSQAERYLQTTVDLGLLATGGSDCHGSARTQPLIGIVKLPYARVDALKQRIGQHATLR